MTPKQIHRKTQYIVNSQPQHVYGAKYHINFQNATQCHHYNSKSTTSIVNHEQRDREVGLVGEQEFKGVSLDDPA